MKVIEIIHSPWLGDVTWDRGCELFFPCGLPGFEQERRMIPVEIPAQRPLVYLQSVEHAGVCFVCLPILAIDPEFELRLSDEEREAIFLGENRAPSMGGDVLCLGLLMPVGTTVESNLSAPIVINLHTSRGIQCMAGGQARTYLRLDENGCWETPC